MTHPPSSSPGASSSYRDARRAAARAHHPDLGGNAESLMAALQQVDDQFHISRGRRPDSPPVGSASRGGLARRLRTLRKALPSRRKYFDIS